METEAAIYTRRANDVITKREMGWMVCDAETDRVIAWCPTLADAERVKALLVYYGGRIPGKPSGREAGDASGD